MERKKRKKKRKVIYSKVAYAHAQRGLTRLKRHRIFRKEKIP